MYMCSANIFVIQEYEFTKVSVIILNIYTIWVKKTVENH